MAEAPEVQVTVTHGAITESTKNRVKRKVTRVASEAIEPILLVTVTLAEELNPAIERRTVAKANLDVNGTLVRAHVAAPTQAEAVDLLEAKLRQQLETLKERLLFRRLDTGDSGPGEWRHGDLPSRRPEYFPRPPGERQVVRRKTYQMHRATPDEVAFDMRMLGHDWFLFTDLATGSDAVLEHEAGDGYRLTLAADIDPPGYTTAIAITDIQTGAPSMTVDDAVAALDTSDAHFLFFADADTRRGGVVYRRYDGHYGLVTPAATGSVSGPLSQEPR